MPRFVHAFPALFIGPAVAMILGFPASGPFAADDDPATDRGIVLEGLQPAETTAACRSGLELEGTGDGRCTHGPDPAPSGINVREPRELEPERVAAATGRVGSGSVSCVGDGVGGNRVQAIYAVASDRPDRFDTVAPLIPGWAAAAENVFSRSAAETGGSRGVRWVTNPDCALNVARVRLSAAGDDSLAKMRAELMAQGFSRSDRKYLVWVDATVYCGISSTYDDDRPAPVNNNNGGTSPLFGRVDSACWGQANSVEAHELVHTMGGVQLSAPNATASGHCTDQYDRMCYGEAGSRPVTYPCPSWHEALLDCNHDDYFHTSPAPGSYLAAHWNVADSSFLSSGVASPTVRPALPPVTSGVAAPGASAVGYRLVATDGRTFGFGGASGTPALPIHRGHSVVAAAATPGGTGAIAVTDHGHVYGIGPATVHGSLAGLGLNRPIVGLSVTPSGNGYWLVASDGGIFAFGDAGFFGSTGNMRLNRPIVGITTTPSGNGYWLVASDGGIFAFGDAGFFGSTGDMRLNRPIVGITTTPSGNGYWLVASDGGIFAFGDAGFFGSTGDIRLSQPIISIAATPAGNGYRFVASDGGVFAFGDADFLGSSAGEGAIVAAMVSAR